MADVEPTGPEPFWPHPTKTSIPSSLSSLSSSTSTSFIISITTLPGNNPTTTAIAACPTVTHTTRPSDCSPFLCPVPGCTEEKELIVPCGCAGVKTALFVDGCQTACPGGCVTRLMTLTAVCGSQTQAPVPIPTAV
ncbi:uncharacterized protein GGS22DRAFT_122986 [Annulohypoxylon maeteangense]|uniref:uncharacterized protein n=1 Tax=Annulohypoxylon maeteangense TaxID=1927788 RepID=UPI00200806F9|nr:uncharacterized protein GGS22DRAFT_122986 [Annulohypoxylon maeteangense]KAI0886038.1 hypothetical protein GGS22DRAFT_122986 [Annulohypoxylon maeteangense]